MRKSLTIDKYGIFGRDRYIVTGKTITEYVGGLPNICGNESLVAEAMSPTTPICLPDTCVRLDRVDSTFAIGLHMHQPLIPAGGDDLESAPVVSNLQHMMDHPEIGDNHNAPAFHQCYKRVGEYIPQLVHMGAQPRLMLDYSGCLLHGLCQMGLHDVIENLRTVTCDPDYRPYVEWLGAPWGHPVAPSTPVQDYRLHVRAWQHFFAALFGLDSLSRVRGFSPCEMALPNHPDVCYEFVKTLKECGYRWILVQEHTVERTEEGKPVHDPHIPHRLVATNSLGQSISITAIIKTQGSDSKLVGQMQPYYEAKTLNRRELAGKRIPAVVTQIADGENGGVMMNEFPPKYMEVMMEACDSKNIPANITEYLEYLDSIGVTEETFPTVQPIMQSRIWDRFAHGDGPEALRRLIEDMENEDHQFHVNGSSWTNSISWTQGYDHVLEPMRSASTLFAKKALSGDIATSEHRYRNALFHLLMTQTSCFRYWGEGTWTDYGRELCRRTTEILKRDF